MKHLIRLLSLILCAALCLGVCAASAETLPEIGSELTFGHYEQDDDLTNGQEPIEWIVLDVDEANQKAFLLSKYSLETRVVYPERVPMYWGASTLREWMNGEFLNAAFTAEEQERILTTTVTNENPHGMKGAGADTEDKLYLLSHEEILHYFPEQSSRMAYATEHAKAQGCTIGEKTGACRWWLRTTGARKMDMWGVRVDGRLTAYGMQDVDWPTNTVRPVFWMDYSK